ncbi:hypothetical protein M422DRAFT_259118 [Sphaerobolus stellatus SS14]|uniref:Uncharacterized protein n=1 Tax=Sphaerobolus stellatus (strain SS14) TaxID=990650 RepID=A0A0C9UTL1_SPHS4|nr:hypothetical protein M422DRAFT_267581 [Sphaerobolus stellatus SS14]KIJ38214.1 hypothetical protein M422DRAFT_259118 [Sphaerobolus stellatus SS14]
MISLIPQGHRTRRLCRLRPRAMVLGPPASSQYLPQGLPPSQYPPQGSPPSQYPPQAPPSQQQYLPQGPPSLPITSTKPTAV